MKFEYIREFVIAAKSDELQNAAATLRISPSSLTKHMSALESELGASLFLRTRGTKLSRYGRIFLPFAKELSELQDSYRLDLSGSTPEPFGELTAGISSVLYNNKARQLLDGFSKSYPRIDLKCVFTDNDISYEKVRNGDCDLAVVKHDGKESEDGLISFPFCSYRLYAIFLKTHPLAGASQLELQQLRYLRTVMDHENLGIGDIVSKKCKALGFIPEIGYLETSEAFDLVRSGEAILLHTISSGLIKSGSSFTAVPIVPEIMSEQDIIIRREPLDGPLWAFMRYAAEKDR